MANRSEDRKKNFESVFEEMESKYGSKKKDEKSSTPTTSNTPTLTPGASREVKQAKRQQNFNNVYSDMEVRYGAASGVTPGYISAFYDDSRNFIIRSASRLNGIDWDAAMSEGANKAWNTEYNSLREREEKIRSYLRENKDSLDPEFYSSINSYLDNFHWSSVDAKLLFSKANKHFSQYKSQEDWFNNAPENYEQRLKKYEDAQKGQSKEPGVFDWMGEVADNIGFGDEVPEGFEDYLKIDRYGYSRYDYDVMARNNQKYLPKYQDMELFELMDTKNTMADGEERDWLNLYENERLESYYHDMDVAAAYKAYEDRFGNKPIETVSYEFTSDEDQRIIANYVLAQEAEKVQTGDRYLQVGDPKSKYYDPDFAKKAAAGDEEFGALEATYIIGTGSVQEGFELSQLTDKEKETLRYHYHEGGLDGAKEYLEHLQPDLARRYADYRYEKMEGNTFLEIAFGIEAGINQFSRGLEGWFTDEPLPYNSTEILQSYVSNDLADVGPQVPGWMGGALTGYDGKSLGQMGFEGVTTVANMAPSLAIGAVSPNTGAFLMGASAGGNAYQEKLRAGYSTEEAAAYGVLVGLSEALLERFLGSIAKVSKTGLTKVTGKALNSFDNVFTRVARSWGGKFLISGFSEAIEEGLQSVIEPFLWQAVSGEEATVDREEAAYSAVMGFLTGSVLGGGQSAINSAVTHHNQRNLGRTIVAADGGMDILMNFANEVSGVSPNSANRINEQAKVAQDKFNAFNAKNESRVKAGKKESGPSRRTARKIGELYQTTTEAYKSYAKEQNVADVAKSLERKGFAPETANKVAKALLTNSEADLTRAQKKILEAAKDDPDIQKTVQDIIVNEKSTMAQRNRRIAELNADIKDGLARTRINTTLKEIMDEEFTPTGEFKISTTGKAIRNGTDEEVVIKGVSSISEGNMMLELEDGSTISAKDVEFASEADALIYEAVSKLGDTIDFKTANDLIALYDGSDATVFAKGITQAYKHGFYQFDSSELSDSRSLTSALTKEQRNAAYKLGKEYRPSHDLQVSAEARSKLAGNKPGEKGVYYRHKDGSTMDIGTFLREHSGKLNARQRTGIEAMRKLADALGVRFNIQEFWVEDGKTYYLDNKGIKREGNPNGFYDTETGEIYIDLYAGKDFNGTLLFTVAHEVTHFMRQWSPEHFRKIQNIIFKHSGMKGRVSELVALKLKKAKDKGEPISYDTAVEEVVADAMETILKDGKVFQFMAELKQKDHAAWQKMKSWFKKLAQFLHKLVTAYKGYRVDSVEGDIIASSAESLLRQIEQIWAEGAVAAGENYQATQESDSFRSAQEEMSTDTMRGSADGAVVQSEATTAIVEATSEATTKNQMRTEYEALPKQVMSLSDGAGTILHTIEGLTPTKLKGLSGKTINGYTGRDVRAWAMRISGFSEAQIKRVNKFMDTMADFMEKAGVTYKFIGLQDVKDAKLHYTYNSDGSIKSIVLSAMVKNGDYPVNFDLSSICKKREAMSKLIDKLAKRGSLDNGTVKLTPANIFRINTALKDAGYETACLGCFVESKRYNSLEWAKTFCNKWNAAVKKVNPNATYFGYGDASFTEDSFTLDQAIKIDEAATKYTTTTKTERMANALEKYRERERQGLPLVVRNSKGVEYHDLSKAAKKRLMESDIISDELKEKYVNCDTTTLNMADVEFLLENGILPGAALSNKQAVTEMVKSGEAYQHLLRPSDLLTDRGISKLEALPNFHGVLYGHYGSGTPKLIQSYTPYNSEIALLPSNKNKDQSLVEYLYSIAGVRMQSFSDFQIQNIYDYLQMVADLSARKLPAHAYTKEISFAKLLGITGIKTNLSVMFDIDPMVDKAHAGLTKLNKLVHRGEYAKVVLEDDQGKWVYNIGDYQTQKLFAEAFPDEEKRFLQSIGFADAVKLQTTPGYSANCGIIGVGYSDLGIFAMLDDNRIRYIIPYHASSLPAEIKLATNIALGTDYTPYQNNMKIKEIVDRNGNKVDWSIKEAYKRLGSGQAVINELNEKIRSEGWVVSTTKAQNGHGSYGLYENLQQTNDPRQTASNFMDWCIGNGTLPLFYQFASHENYYKLLYDYNVYDCVTEEYAPQQAVTNTYPTMVDGQVQTGDVTEGGFDTEYLQGTIDKQMSFMNAYNENRNADLEKLAENMEEGNYSLIRFSERETLEQAADSLAKIGDKEYLKAKEEHPFIIVMDHTPDTVLQSMKGDGKAVNRRVLIRRDALYLAIREDGVQEGHYHGLGAEVLKKLPEYLEQPDVILKTDSNTKKRLVLVSIPTKSGQAIISVEFESVKDFEGTNEYFNVIVTVFDLHKNYLKGLFKKHSAEIKYEKEDLVQVNPQLHEWLRTFNTKPSNEKVTQPDPEVKKNSDDGAKKSDRDDAYIAAVNRGDMETVQRMVDEAAKSATYDAEMFHETDAENIHIFDISRGTHGGTDYQTPYGIFTKTSSKNIGLGRRQMKLFVKAHNTLRVENREDVLNKIPGFAKYYEQIQAIDKKYDALSNQLEDEELNALYEWMEEHPDVDMDEVFPTEYIAEGKPADIDSPKYLEAHEKYMKNRTEWEESYNAVAVKAKAFITDYLRNNDYDSMYFVVDGGSRGRQTDSLIVLDENQVKSADPVTYDDDGNIIPLSDRFNTEKDDIRYSERTSNADLAEMDDTALYIKNTDKANYIGMIFNGTKTEETRGRRTLDAFIGKDFYVTDGKYVYGSIVMGKPHKYTEAEFHKRENQRKHRVPKGDEYDIKPGGIKWAYPIESYKKFDKPKKLSDSTEYKNSFQARQVLYQDRDTDSVSNRSLLANAFEGIAKPEEQAKVREYKEKVDLINAEEKKLRDLNEQIKELSFSKGPRDTKKIRELRDEATKTANRISTLDNILLRLEAAKPLQDVLSREKALAYKRGREKGNEAMSYLRDRQLKSATATKIKNFKKKLERTLLRPTDRQYVPIDLIKAMVEVCELIDTDTSLYKADGSINKAQEQREATKEKLQNLKEEYEKLKTNSDPIYAGEFDEMVYTYITELRDNFSGKNLKEMSTDELTEMYEILRAIDETLQDARKLIGWGDAEDVYEAGDAIVEEQKEITRKRKNGNRSAAQKTKDVSLNLSLSPVRNVERMSGYNGDSRLLKLFKKFEQGIRKKNKFMMNAYKSFEALTSGKEYEDAIYKAVGGKKYEDVNGRKFGLSKMQMMQAILSYERETANGMSHIKNSGFSFADLDMLNKGKLRDAISEEYSHRMPAATDLVAEFAEILKDDQWCQAYMKAARKFFNETAKDAINETSIILKHRIIAKDKNYIPFEVDKNFVVREISAQNDVQQTINSYGMLKDTKKGAPQPLIITGLNNIIDRHIDQVGNVYGLAVEVRNFNKVWNVRSLDDIGNDPTVKTAVQRNWGVEGVKHIEQAVQDIQGPRIRERSAIYDKFKSGYISSTFLLNLSVVTKQIGSLFSATSMIRWRDPARLIGNLFYTMANSKKISAEVDKYTASAWMRRQGLSDAELHTLMTQAKKKGFFRFLDKLPSVINPTKWITAMDHAVALSLWRYAKIDTAKRTGLKGEELLKATAEFYDEVIENTQSMSDVLHRPEIQKKDGVIAESFAMFKTDLYQMAGQLLVTAGRWATDKSKANTKALGRTLYSIAMNAVWGQLMTTVFALLRYKVNQYRDDEDEDLTFESWMKRQGFSFAGDLMGYIFPIFGSEVVGFFENIMYGESDDLVDSVAISAINDLYDSMITIGTSITDGEWPDPTDMRKLTAKVLQIFGIPANNIERTWNAIMLHAKDIANGEFFSFEAGADRSSGNHMHRIIEAVDAGKTDVAVGLFDDAVEEIATEKADGGEYGDDEVNEAKSDLKTALGEKYKDGEVTEETTTKILSEVFGMDEDDIYWTLDKWGYAKENGSSEGYAKYDDFFVAVETGKNLKAVIKEYTDNGVSTTTLKDQITSHFKPLYVKMSTAEKANIKGYILNAMTALGDDREEAEKNLREWEFESKYGFAYDDKAKAYKEGAVSASQLKTILMSEGGMTEEEADHQIEAYNWEKQGYEGVTPEAVRDYNEHCASSGVPKDVYLHIRSFANNTKNDTDSNGETIYYSAMKKVMAEINSQYGLTSAQKTAIARSLGWAEKNIQKYKPW